MMIRLHHLETSRSQRVLWLLEELGTPYELVTYRRDSKTRFAPPELKQIHPLGKSPVLTDEAVTVAESGTILEYLGATHGRDAGGELASLVPDPGAPEYWSMRYWMHFAEGSLMNWLVMKLVFTMLPAQPMPFFAKPIARAMCAGVQTRLIDPNVEGAMRFMEVHLSTHHWFAGEALTLADFQMCFAIEAALSRHSSAAGWPNLERYKTQLNSRPAYRRAIDKGGPVVMGA